MTDNQDRIATDPNKIDAIKLSLMLTDLRLPTINQLWQGFAKRADAEGWTAARFLATLVEHELAERDRRRIERHLRQARLIPGKTLDAFDFSVVPMISKAQVNALAAGDAWLDQGANCLIFGPPGVGKSHLASAIGLALARLPQLGGHEDANSLNSLDRLPEGRHYKAANGEAAPCAVRRRSGVRVAAARSCRAVAAVARAPCSAGCGAAGRGAGRRWLADGRPPSGWWRRPQGWRVG